MSDLSMRASLLLKLLYVGIFLGFTLLGIQGGRSQGDDSGWLRGLAVPVFSVVLAGVVVHLIENHRRLRHMEDLLTDVRFGEGTRRDRDAVDILIRALRTSDGSVRESALKTLRKLAGMDLGKDPAVWEQWWSGARKTFVRASSSPPSPPGKK